MTDQGSAGVDAVETFSRLMSSHLNALTRVIYDAADEGFEVMLERLGDYLNAQDAVGDGDAEAWDRAMERARQSTRPELDA